MKYSLIITTFFFQSFFCLSQTRKDDDTLFIPVVFHILTKEDLKDINIKENRIFFEDVVSDANTKMNNVVEKEIKYGFGKDIGIPNIELFIPSQDENCKPIEGISYHKHPISLFGGHIPNVDDGYLKKYGYLDSKKFLNVWVVDLVDFKLLWNDCKNNIGILEGHNADILIDGILLDRKNLIYKTESMKITFIHELGHYLGLQHTWGFNSDCILDDGINDTPLQSRSNKNRNIPLKACFSNNYTNHQNYMDYSPHRKMFTEDQVLVMRNELKFKRSDLLWKKDCGIGVIIDIYGFFTDERDNQKYKWVRVGNKKWMADNLNFNSPNSATYDNKEYNGSIYGRLYNWNEAVNVCPKGWRLPNSNDWKDIHYNFGNSLNSIKSTQGWLNENGTNYRELNILPSGYYNVIRQYKYLGKRASFWLADDLGNNSNRNSRTIREGFNEIPLSGIHFAREKLSCRCIQDI